jgi:lipoate-protein ligase A
MAYTFVCRARGFKERQGLAPAVGQVFVDTLRELGVPAELVRTGAPPAFTRHAPSLCFTSLSQCEVMVKGRKVIGRATREKGDFRLEQGFILLNNDYQELVDFLPENQSEKKNEILDRIREKCVSIMDTGKQPVPFNQLAIGLRQAAGRVFGATWKEWRPQRVDEEAIMRLVSGKYGNAEWLFRF